MELLDIVDENNNLTGERINRKKVHEIGLWHREVSIYIINENKEILIQKRASSKKFYPNVWALCAGHIDTGEQPEIAAIREMKEEIGLNANRENMKFLGVQKISKKRDKVINNYFKYVYLVKTNKKINEYKIQYEELSEVKYIKIKDLIEVIKNKDENYSFANSKRMLEFLENIDDYI